MRAEGNLHFFPERYPWIDKTGAPNKRQSPFFPFARSTYVIDLLQLYIPQRRLMGKTLLDPKKDSKWERGRTRRVLHFGAHVMGGRVVGVEVGEDDRF